MTAIDTSKIESVEERRKAAELVKQREALDAELSAAMGDVQRRWNELFAKLTSERDTALQPLNMEMREIRAGFDERFSDIDRKLDELGIELSWEHSDYEHPDVCALCGLPVLEGETVLVNGNEVVIRALLPLAPADGADDAEDAA